MKKNLILICLFCYSANGIAQNTMTSKDSISTFYNALISVMKTDYLYKDKIDWQQLESKLNDSLAQYDNFQMSLNQITPFFNNCGAEHCSVYVGENAFFPTQKSFNGTDFSEQWINKYSTQPEFEVNVIDDKYGYILIPAMNFEDISLENIHKLSQPLYDKIVEIKQSKKIKGWIIDLRFNSGGNVHPMALALYDFLGDNSIYGTMDINKEIISIIKLKKGKYFDNDSITSFVIPKGKRLTKKKVAIITGIVTVSSGEIIAMAFKGRGNTIFIGEPTMGMTTTNDKRELPFGAFMALTVGYDCDRNGVYYEQIIPDIQIEKEDNFENMLLDKNIQQAIKFFDGN